VLPRRFSPLDNPSKLDWVANDRGWLANRSAVSKPQCPEGFLHARYFAETSTITALGMRSSAERHQLAIGLVLTFVGLAAVGAIHFLGARGSFATMIGAFAAFTLRFGQGFRWNRGPVFPPSTINRQNRWRYLVFAAIVWEALFLLRWFRVRPLARPRTRGTMRYLAARLVQVNAMSAVYHQPPSGRGGVRRVRLAKRGVTARLARKVVN
jgi:hypothetical protein